MITNANIENVYENFGVDMPESNVWNLNLVVAFMTEAGRYDVSCSLKSITTSDRKLLAELAQYAVHLQNSEEFKNLTDIIVCELIPEAIEDNVSVEERIKHYVADDPTNILKIITDKLDSMYATLRLKRGNRK